MIVSELIDLLKTQDPEKIVGINWGDDPEIVAWVEDLLLMQNVAGYSKHIGAGQHGVIFLTVVEDGESSLPLGALLESLSECNAAAQVAITSGDKLEEPDVGYVVGGVDLDEDIFVLNVQRKEFIKAK